MSHSLKEQAVLGAGWSAIERFATQGSSFLIQLVLARLLLPEDYGAIAMLAIFLQVASVFIDSGFANALIKKLDCTEEDYSTVFFYNLAISIVIYLLFFFSAPFVASFYKVPILTEVMRVISITLILNALCIVHRTKLIKEINFKTQTKISIISVIVSGAVGIYLAYNGWGVWALCLQSIVNSLMQLILFGFYVYWRPKLKFSIQSFREMFGFGSKLLVAGLITVIYNNLYTIVIGKRFDSHTLGLFSRADNFSTFPSTNIGNIISRVSLPVLSNIQDDDVKLVAAYRKILRYATFIISPLMLGLFAVSHPLISVLLTDKWLGLVPFLQILCLGLIIDHLNGLNINLLYVKGRSDLVLRIEVIKKTVALAILFGTIPFGVMVMCIGKAVYAVIAIFINTFYSKKLIGLSVWQQFRDISPYVLASVIMGLIIVVANGFICNELIKLIVGVSIGIMIYFVLTMLFFKEEVKDVLSVIKK